MRGPFAVSCRAGPDRDAALGETRARPPPGRVKRGGAVSTQWFPSETWKYALLLVLLFAIAAIAAHALISYVDTEITMPRNTPPLESIAIAVWAFTLGFMCLSGALGLWSIRSEGERRIRTFVEDMGYLSDGLLVLNRKGRIIGSNPASRNLAPSEISQNPRMRDIFPNLTVEELRILLDVTGGPREIEKDILFPNGVRTLRFRSEPSKEMGLILLSDVTEQTRLEQREQQVAQLKLVGRLARGVAHDFSNILCSILGHADLLARAGTGSESDRNKHLESIRRTAEKGSVLAQHLLDFGTAEHVGTRTENPTTRVRRASDLLRLALPKLKRIELTVEGEYPAVELAPQLIEQAVLNIGLLCADSAPQPATVRITVCNPGQDHLSDVDRRFAVLVLISAHSTGQPPEPSPESTPDIRPSSDDPGVIQSIVRSMLDQVGGRLDIMVLPHARTIYRLCLPRAKTSIERYEATAFPDGVADLVSAWSVMLAYEANTEEGLEDRLRDMGATVDRVDNTVSALARIQEDTPPDAMVIEKRLLDPEAHGLLRAVTKLCPRTGIVVLCEEPDEEPEIPNVLYTTEHSNTYRIIRDMLAASDKATQKPPPPSLSSPSGP